MLVVLAFILYSVVKSIFGSGNVPEKTVTVKEDIFGRKTIDVESEIIDNDKNESGEELE